MRRPALFLDRDGVINEYRPYVHRVEDFDFVDGIFDLVTAAGQAGYLIVVVTNQAGIGRVPITAKLVANLITRAGADRVLAMDLHAAQIQGFFDVPVDHLYAAPVLNNHLQSLDLPHDELVVVSADAGGIKRAVGHANHLGAPLAIVDKRRLSADTTKSTNVIGADVSGKIALMFDDMISTAGSICSAAEVVHRHGAKAIYAAATHGLLVGPAIERLKAAPFAGIIITDSIPLPPEKSLPNITVLSVASLLGQAIKRIHRNESVSMMFQ